MQEIIRFFKRSAIALLLLAFLASSCTEQQRAKNFGGEAHVRLPRGQKLVTATWKEDDLWVLTRSMGADEHPATYQFAESSSFGLMQGVVIIRERR